MLPGIDDFGLCRVPILMVTAREEEADKVRGIPFFGIGGKYGRFTSP
jgi:DNA-binding response OmpR family regulator